MAQRRLSVRKIREILRLRYELGLSQDKIAESCGIGRSTVSGCLSKATVAGLKWPVDESISDDALEERVYGQRSNRSTQASVVPDWSEVHRELKRKGVTRLLLWQEFRANQPDGVEYSAFCDRYRKWAKKNKLSMRMPHRAGEKLFVDYAGQKIQIKDPRTGQERPAEIFVAVWGASNYTYAEATWTQSLPDWTSSHVRAFEFFDCVPDIVVPDCLKSAVNKACRYDPDINQTYAELARHYGVAVVPARARKPKDKAKAETGVQIVTRWILAALRKRTFFSLSEANQAIAILLGKLNEKPFQKLPGSRLSGFLSLDKPASRALPDSRYEYAEIKTCRVNIDYHIEVSNHLYSVPHRLKGEQVAARITGSTVEVLFKGRRVCSHIRKYKYGYTTDPKHMPRNHRAQKEWSAAKMIAWARSVGINAAALVEGIFASLKIEEQGYRQCLGLMRLVRRYGPQRVERAATIACKHRLFAYRHIKNMLESNQDKKPQTENRKAIHHEFVRGKSYYLTAIKGEKGDEQCDNRELEGSSLDGNGESHRGTQANRLVDKHE